jgi:hypothetical protein
MIYLELSVNERMEELRREAQVEALRAQLPPTPSPGDQAVKRMLRGALQSGTASPARSRRWSTRRSARRR